MTDWKERAERAEAELARLRAQKPAAWVRQYHHSGVLCWENEGGNCAPLYRAAPPAQPATRKDCGEAGCAEGRCGNAGCLPSAQPAEPVQRLSDAGIEALAGKHGTTYRNRHFPTQPAFSFSNGSLHRFVRDIESALQTKATPKGGA